MRTRRFHNPAINSLTVVQLILMLMSASAQFSSYHGGNDGFWTVSLGPTDPLSPSSPFLQEHDSKSRWSAIPSSKSKSKGRIKVDLRGNIFKLTRADPPFNTTTLQEKDDDSLSMTIDPMSTWRLLKLSFSATSSLASAFMGTLRLLAPL